MADTDPGGQLDQTGWEVLPKGRKLTRRNLRLTFSAASVANLSCQNDTIADFTEDLNVCFLGGLQMVHWKKWE